MFWVEVVAAHEAGHVAVAERLGYRVPWAQVYGTGEGGFTREIGWGDDAWHTMVMAAADRAG